MFLMIEGIDGSGKSTIATAIVQYLKETEKRLFDISDWAKNSHELPTEEQFENANILFASEPTYAWVGKCIREEMIFDNARAYHSREIASAFALDRLVLYKRCYLPALRAGKSIIADRGVASSLTYQPIDDPDIKVEELVQLHGNALALKHAPNHLIIASIDPKISLERILERTAKQDKSIFDNLDMQTKIHEAYHSDWFQKLFQERGTKIHYLDTSGTIEDTRKNALNLFKTLS